MVHTHRQVKSLVQKLEELDRLAAAAKQAADERHEHDIEEKRKATEEYLAVSLPVIQLPCLHA